MRLALLFVCFLFTTLTATAQTNADGCGATTFEAGTAERSLTTADGRERTYLLHLPASYDGSAPVPLVLNLHGFLSSADQMVAWTGWDALAASENFIVVYPQGGGLPTRWNAGNAGFIGNYDVDDVAFLNAIITEVQTDLCIDAARIFMSGLSNGAGMTNRFACQMADVVAAIGTAAGAYTSWDTDCTPARPVPVIAFHGTADRIVAFEGTTRGSNIFPPIEAWALNWALRNGCDREAVSVPLNTTITATAYPNCDADVILYVIDGGGHVWPGESPLTDLFESDPISSQIDATLTMWAFFKNHPLP